MASIGMDNLANVLSSMVNLNIDREIYLYANKSTIQGEWIDELKDRIDALEEQNQKLHLLIGTSAFKITEV